jgi:hypothetical protein
VGPGKGQRCPLNRRLGGPQSPSERFGEKKRVPAGIRTPDRALRTLINIMTISCSFLKPVKRIHDCCPNRSSGCLEMFHRGALQG